MSDLVSIFFMLSRDGELPRSFSSLNAWGMPKAPLILATVVPIGIVLVIPDVGMLADLYAIGVVAAVAINLCTTSTNKGLEIHGWERAVMLSLGIFMTVVWLTIAYQKPHALIFAGSILGLGLSARLVMRHWPTLRRWLIRTTQTTAGVESEREVEREVAAPERTGPVWRILVPTQGEPKLIQYALQEAKEKNAEALFLFVRHIAVPMMRPWNLSNPADDPEAQSLFERIRKDAADQGVKAYCLYASAWNVSDVILEFAVTYGVDTVILGASRRGTLWQAMKGDVIRQVAPQLPDSIELLIHA